VNSIIVKKKVFSDGLYNCTSAPGKRWSIDTPIQYYIGVLYFTLVLYVPCLLVMARASLTQHSCFKIMFFLGINDILCLYLGGSLAGVLSILGYTYCSSPNLLYVVGCFGLGTSFPVFSFFFYFGETNHLLSCGFFVILTMDRFVDLFYPTVHVFTPKNVSYWCLLPGFCLHLLELFLKPFEEYKTIVSNFFKNFFPPNLPAPCLFFSNFFKS
ncbi:unnamed protein product, partial [Enterobius vermicularis]|uniref:G_PROTEIN_RECEP_F1_2 domain-containing protein n=1 Tax=Enterobius vermicularis TaxID=51028 RepID=A0A0N4VH03_ENTVE